METLQEKMEDFRDGCFAGISAEIGELSGDETAVVRLLTERVLEQEGLVAMRFSSRKNKVPEISSVSVPSASENPVEISTEEWQLWQEFLEKLRKQRPQGKDQTKKAIFQIPFDQIPKKKRSKRTRAPKSTPEQFSVPCVENSLQMPMEEWHIGVEQLQTPTDGKTFHEGKRTNLVEGEEDDKKLKKQRKNRPNPATEDLPSSFRTRIEQMGGTNTILVVQKELYKSDIGSDQGRFLIPPMQMNRNFLTQEESQLLEKYHRNKYSDGDMRVVIVEPSLETSTLSLRVWDVNSKLTHVLVKDWKLIVKRNGLKIGDIVQLWSFRIGSQLCFALSVSGSPPDPALCRTDDR